MRSGILSNVGLIMPKAGFIWKKYKNPKDRIFLNVEKVAATGCMEWKMCRGKEGYGKTAFRGVGWSSHRLAWELLVGPIPEGMHVLHKCDNPPCCNPDHLFLGTPADNYADMAGKGRSNKGMSFNVGERHGNSKLMSHDIHDIKWLLSVGIVQRRVAEIFGLHENYVQKINTGRARANG